MKLAYLINQYPKVSHSFIRREILALEELGYHIFRYTIRPTRPEELIATEDIAERENTRAILSVSITRLFSALLWTFLSVPLVFIKAFIISTRFGWINKRGVLKHWAYLAEACILRGWLMRNKIGHIHAHFGTNSTTVVLLCKILGGPSFSFTVHGSELFNDPVGLALSEKINHSKFVVAISSFGCSQLMRHCPYSQWRKIKIVHCAVDDTFLGCKPTTLPNNNRLVCVGRLSEEKGQLLLLEAVCILKKSKFDLEVVLAGDGEMREVIENRIKELDLEKQVKITGWIDGNEVRQQIINSRAMVLPSFAEGLPVVIMEAFALGRPVVSTYIAGIPELVENEINGFLVPAGSVGHLATALKKVLSTDLAILQKMGQEGMRRVAMDHSARDEAKKLASFFKASISH